METDGTYESRDTTGARYRAGGAARTAAPSDPGTASRAAHRPDHAATATRDGAAARGPAFRAAARPAQAGHRARCLPPRARCGHRAHGRLARRPRPEAAPGIWRFRHVPPPPPREARRLAPVTVAGLLIPLVVGLLLWSAWRRGAVPYQSVPLIAFTPADWWYAGTTSPRDWHGEEARAVYDGVFFAVLLYAIARLGAWAELARHHLPTAALPRAPGSRPARP